MACGLQGSALGYPPRHQGSDRGHEEGHASVEHVRAILGEWHSCWISGHEVTAADCRLSWSREPMTGSVRTKQRPRALQDTPEGFLLSRPTAS